MSIDVLAQGLIDGTVVLLSPGHAKELAQAYLKLRDEVTETTPNEDNRYFYRLDRVGMPIPVLRDRYIITANNIPEDIIEDIAQGKIALTDNDVRALAIQYLNIQARRKLERLHRMDSAIVGEVAHIRKWARVWKKAARHYRENMISCRRGRQIWIEYTKSVERKLDKACKKRDSAHKKIKDAKKYLDECITYWRSRREPHAAYNSRYSGMKCST